ncbi:ATP-binding cassette domain-containing protein [uncultured Maricaulis sp.]|uniref:ABC transporter ATP-binding protein n=1 Tax=uncultured Maricaulis sp. TaxID=174710 RepID=UPI0030DC5838|tara:strand:+ start:69075 stop:70034 length:960 start_codon:yes stop_codon:yes gene_type:complete
MSEIILSLAGVSKTFNGKAAVSDLSFDVRRGKITGFLGPNGAGKSTSLRMALGILTPDSGQVSLFGGRPRASALERVGFLPEERGLYRKMKVIDVIIFFARLKGVAPIEARRRGLAMLDEFGLGDVAESKVKTLSKGMAQKIQIIATLIHDPEFIILDEPFSGLDPVNQKALERIVRARAEAGATILFSTHVMEHAERLCDQIVLVARGRKVFDGTVEEALGHVPRRVVLETVSETDLTPVFAPLGEIAESRANADGAHHWMINLGRGVEAQDVLKACVDGNIKLLRFEPARAHLHDAFVHLVETSGQFSNEKLEGEAV